jgi:cob(I)alamin adenosyltransferase
MEEALPPMTHFVFLEDIPLCHIVILHVALCRRAERLAVHLSHNEPVAEIAIT